MEIAVWILGGILALNVAVVAGLAGLRLAHRQRIEWARRGLEQRLHVPSLRRPTPTLGGSTVGRVTGVVLVGVLVMSVVALAGVDTGRVFTTALDVVVPGGLVPAEAGHAERGGTRAGPLEGRAGEPRPGTEAAWPGAPDPLPSSPAAPADHADVPVAVAAVPRSASAIRVVWADVPAAIGYAVERSDDGVTGWAEVATTPMDITVYTDVGLDAGTTYFYRVVATTPAGEAPPSDVTSATTTPSPPATTTLTLVGVSSSSVDLAWLDVADETGYRIERSSDGVTWTTIATTGQDVLSYTDAGLTAGTTYLYRVVATNAGGDAPASAPVSATTAAGGSPGPDGDGGDGAAGGQSEEEPGP